MPGVTGITGINVIPFGGSYTEKIAGMGPIAYWVQGEAVGPASIDQIDSPDQDGVYAGVTLGQDGIGDGRTCPLFDAVNDFNNIHTATFAGIFDGTEGTVGLWARVNGVGVWTDGAFRTAISLRADANNYALLRKSSANNQFDLIYRSGGVTKVRSVAAFNPVTWFNPLITWSEVDDEVIAYMDGVQRGAVLNALGVWAGVLAVNTTVIGASTTVPVNVWDGYLAHIAVWDRALTPDEVARMAVI